MFRGDEVCCFVIIGVTWNNSSPASPIPIQIVRALEHLHSKLSVIHRGQCPPPALRLREGQTETTWWGMGHFCIWVCCAQQEELTGSPLFLGSIAHFSFICTVHVL